MNLLDLREKMKLVGSKDTAYGQYLPDRYGPLHAHCGCVSYIVQKMYGGDLVRGTRELDGVRVSHIWNSINGLEFDLCSEQFGYTDLGPVASGKIIPPRKNINSRFRLFEERLNKVLNT